MSFSFSFAATDIADAKEQLAAKVADESNHIPTCVGEIVAAAMDALPTASEGYSSMSVSAYGHFNDGEHPGASNLNLSVQTVANVGDQAKAA